MLRRIGRRSSRAAGRRSARVRSGSRRRLALRPGAACARKTPISRSASAATPTARATSADCRSRAIGTAASRWAREQVKEGSHALDLCTAFVGRDEVADMTEVVTRMRGAVNAPLVIEFDRVPGARSRAASSMAASRSSTRSISRMARRRPKAPAARAPVRRRGHRADHRRDRHGQGGRAQARGGAAAPRFRLRQARPAGRRICCSTR